MFGDPVKNPMGWEQVDLDDGIDLINGRAFKPREWSKVGVPIIRIQNFQNKAAPFNYYDGEFEERHAVKSGDLLFSWSGQLVSFGVFIWDGPAGVLNQHIFNVKPLIPYELEFVQQTLRGIIEVAKIKFHGIEMKHLTKTDLSGYRLLYPSLPLQQKFARVVQQFERLRAQQREHERQAEHLFQTLLQRAFRGEV